MEVEDDGLYIAIYNAKSIIGTTIDTDLSFPTS